MYGGHFVRHVTVSSLVAAGLTITPGVAAAGSAGTLAGERAPEPIIAPTNATMSSAFGRASDGWRPPSGLQVTPADAEVAARRTAKRWEATAARTETTRLYVNPDGSRTLVAASGRMHVRRPEGWVDFDTRLQAAGGGVRAVAAGADVTFSAGGSAPLVRWREGGGTVEIGWPTPLPVPILAGDTAKYREVKPGVDLLVRATPEGFEHSVVLTRRPASAPEVRLPLRLSGLSLSTTADGSLVLADDTGSHVAQAAAPAMFDSGEEGRGKQKRALLPHAIENGADGPELVLRADASFLNDAMVTYPVTLDPTWRRGRDSDVWVQQGNSAWQGNSTELRVGNFSGNVARTYATFELSALAGMTVSAATMKLYNYSSSCLSRGVAVHQVLSGWDPATITWSGPNQPQVATTALTSKSFAHSIYDSACPPPSPEVRQHR